MLAKGHISYISCISKILKTAYSTRNGVSTKWKKHFLSQLREEMIHPAMIKAFRQLSTKATMCMQWFPCLNLPTSPMFLIFCYQKNLPPKCIPPPINSSKSILAKNNLWLKSYHGHRAYGPTAKKILLTLQVVSCTPEAMIQLTCFTLTWRALMYQHY